MNDLSSIAQHLKKYGRYGDTMLAHISPEEALMLEENGGSGTINPETGLPEYWKGWKAFRKIAKIAAPIAGSLLLPGIGTALGIGGLTTATGASTALGGGLGGAIGGGIGGGLGGGGIKGALGGAALGGAGGYLANGGFSQLAPQASSYLGNSTGNLIGTGTSATGSLGQTLGYGDIAGAIGRGFQGAGNSISDAVGSVGKATGISDLFGAGNATPDYGAADSFNGFTPGAKLASDSSVSGDYAKGIIGSGQSPSIASSLFPSANNAISSLTDLAKGGAGAGLAGYALGSQGGQDGDSFAASSVPSFKPSRAGASALPDSLSGYGSLDPLQQSTNLATQGVYGGGLGGNEQDYFLNEINRKLIDDAGNVDQNFNDVAPIESSYLDQLGYGANDNVSSLLEALSKRKRAV